MAFRTRTAKKRFGGGSPFPGSKEKENQIAGSLPGGCKLRVTFGAAQFCMNRTFSFWTNRPRASILWPGAHSGP